MCIFSLNTIHNPSEIGTILLQKPVLQMQNQERNMILLLGAVLLLVCEFENIAFPFGLSILI